MKFTENKHHLFPRWLQFEHIFFIVLFINSHPAFAEDRIELNDGTVIFADSVESLNDQNYLIRIKSEATVIRKATVTSLLRNIIPPGGSSGTLIYPETQEQPIGVKASAEEPFIRKDFTSRVFGGRSLSAQTNSNLINRTGSRVGELNSKDLGGIALSVELEKHLPDDVFGYGIELALSKYSYDDGSEPDSHFSLFFNPRIYLGGGRFKLWFTPGSGISLMTIGTPKQNSSDYQIVLDESATSFAIYPKLAVETEVHSGLKIGARIGYFAAFPNLSGTINSGGSTSDFKMDLSRSWFDVGVFFAVPF